MTARDRLIVEWAVTTGVRRMEIAGSGSARCQEVAYSR